MGRPRVVAIYTSGVLRQPMESRNAIRAVAGRGLEKDRYFQGDGVPPEKRDAGRHVTLIEAEAIEALERDCGITLQPSETRRNLVTRDVALNHLVGREFRVGAILMRGVRLCEPCSHLQKMTQPGVLKGLLHRGGLRAEILGDGEICVDDPIDVS